MSANLQPIPLGLLSIKPFVDFVVNTGSTMEEGDTTYQNDNFISAPSLFIDGLLITYAVRSDRRYISFNSVTKTVTLHNGGVNEGEVLQFFL